MNSFLFQSEICLKSMLKYVKLNIVVVITLCVDDRSAGGPGGYTILRSVW